jgi:PAS domain S-box-containing protein
MLNKILKEEYAYVDYGNGVVHHDDGCLAVTGFSSEDYKKNPNLGTDMVLDFNERVQIAEARRLVLEEGRSIVIHHRILHRDGSTRYVRNHLRPLKDGDQIVGYIGTIIDITKLIRKMCEDEQERDVLIEALSNVNAELMELTETLAVRVHEETARSRQAEQLLIQQSKMASMGEMLGMIGHQWRQPLNVISLLLADLEEASKHGELKRIPIHQSTIEAILGTNHPSVWEAVFVEADFFVEIPENPKPKDSNSEDSSRFCFFFFAEDALLQIEENKELSPLQKEQLITLLQKSDPLSKAVTEAKTLIQFLSKTIEVFRDFLKPTKEKTVFSTMDAIQKTISFLKKDFDYRNIRFEVHGHSSHCSIKGYPNELIQVFLALFTNARDAIEAQRSGSKKKTAADIFVDVKLIENNDSQYVQITIEDLAGGIPEEVMSRIFKPYFTTKSSQNGTGIGLYMAKAIIEENMEGKITAENAYDSEGKVTGAKFTIELPVVGPGSQ